MLTKIISNKNNKLLIITKKFKTFIVKTGQIKLKKNQNLLLQVFHQNEMTDINQKAIAERSGKGLSIIVIKLKSKKLKLSISFHK